MTKERASANDEGRPAEFVNQWENDEVKGHALCAAFMFEDHVKKAKSPTGTASRVPRHLAD